MRPSKRHRLEAKQRQLEWRRPSRHDPQVAQRLIDGQKPRAAILAGAAVAAAAAMVWMIVALATETIFQALAIAIGAVCGLAVGYFGRAVDRRYGRMSACFCILACAVGEILVAYALRLDIWLLYTRNSLMLLAVFVLAGALTAHLCTFAWLSRDQKRALLKERQKEKT